MDTIKVSLHQSDGEALLKALQDIPCVPDVVRTLETEGIDLVSEVCKLGFTDVLEFLINQDVEISSGKGKETPVQTASRHNKPEIIKLLLKHGVPVLPEGVQVWQENSPFYIASRYGHLEIANLLLAHNPSHVSREDTRMSLVYAACLGGNIDIIKRWIDPGMDINQPLRHIESFTDCEKKTPLFAACSAGHQHVIDFLIENFPELQFTDLICQTFPDIIGETMVNFFTEVPSKQEDDFFRFYQGKFSHRNLHLLHERWLEPFHVTLVELDISDNSLTELPDCVPWKLQNLRVLKASYNNLKHLSKSEPAEEGDELCPRLEEINLMKNHLEKVCPELFQIESLKQLNLSYNRLENLFRSRHQLAEWQIDRSSVLNRQSCVTSKGWSCVNLTRLDISHNMLKMIPAEISDCTGLVNLIANNNRLTCFPTPWDCPLYQLNLSHNELERFPPSAEMFWCGTLKYLDISHNQLEEINETVVKLCVLIDLNASNNKIEHLPGPAIWELSHLHLLNLKHNRLGVGSEKRERPLMPLMTRTRPNGGDNDRNQLLFPMTLSYCLKELRLSDNNLKSVPLSICDLKSLEILDISHNPIKSLPKELGRLKNCGCLKLKGLPLDKYDTSDTRKTKEILSSLLEQLRDCRPYCKMKMVVIGKKDKGKTTLVNLLTGKKNKGVQIRSGVHKEEITIKKRKPSGSFPISFGAKNDIKFSVWDIEGSEEYTLIHHCVYTEYSLYLLVWDFWSIEKEISDIASWLYNIQASCKAFQVILVGTFLDKMSLTPEAKKEEVARIEALIHLKIPYARESLQLCPVSCINFEGIDQLNNTIYETACSMKLPGKNGQYLIGRKCPSSYFKIEQELQKEQTFRASKNLPPFLTKCQFNELLERLPARDNDIDSVEEEQAVTKFLIETGSLLHYSDQLGALNTLYFLDPAWLCDILVKVFTSPYGKLLLTQGKGKVNRNEVIRLYNEDERFPSFLNDQYIKLLERFEIAVPVNNCHIKKRSSLLARDEVGSWLFFPSKLPDNPPLDIEPTPPRNLKKVCRLYRMAEQPSGFWTRLLSRMMTRVEQFSRNEWFYGPVMKQSVRTGSGKKLDGSYKDIHKGKSFHGLKIANAQSSFCREWLKVQYDEGSFCIEPVTFQVHPGERCLPKGVLITEKSTNEEFAIMGIIIDEIEDIIQDYYPGLLELDDTTMQYRLQRYAICPSCYQQKIPPKDLNHFSIEHCARMLMLGNTINCPSGVKHSLNDLIPDMLLKEIPDKFFLDVGQLRLEEKPENFLGGGVTGSVFKGKYGDLDIAIKLYRSDIRHKREDDLFTQSRIQTDSSDSGTETMSSKGSIGAEGIRLDDTPDGEDVYVNFTSRGIDINETESIKAFKALREMRQEVALTSRLKHPCVVALVGISFSPKLLMALELAPLGSFRSVIDKHLNNRPEVNRYRDRDKLNPPLFSKELTFKFLHQIAKGLEYLHCNGIIYKDLKSDNILVMSENLNASVNIKLSDYGISKYCWSGGTVGLVGTPGYQAPEILDGLPYDEKVDIFSFAMVIFETITGRRPYQEYDNMSQIAKAIKTENKRPNIRDFNIHSQSPYLESLMQRCWHKNALERPAATEIINKRLMQNCRFVALTSVYTGVSQFSVDCLLGAPSHDPGHTTVWLWEGQGSGRQLTVLDLETSKPRQSLGFEGSSVTCMARVGADVWVGSEDNMIDIFGKDKTSGTLSRVDTLQLDGCPVQIEALSSDTVRRVPLQSVYIALSNAKICRYETETPTKPERARRGTVRTVVGFKDPKTITLRTRKLFCMVFTKDNGELWVSVNHYIDVIDVKSFMVDKSKTICLRMLLAAEEISQNHDVDFGLNVVQMVRSSGRVWCLLKDSPFILEFCEDSYNCLSLLKCDEEMLLNKDVRTVLNFDETTHTMYHQLQRMDSNTSSSESDEEEYVFPLSRSAEGTLDDSVYNDLYFNKTGEESVQRRRSKLPRSPLTTSVSTKMILDDDSIYKELYSPGVENVQRRRLTNARQTFGEFKDSHENSPPVPLRNKSLSVHPSSPSTDGPPVPLRKTPETSPVSNNDSTDVPPLPERQATGTPPLAVRSGAPPVPRRNTCESPKVLERRNARPPVPSRKFLGSISREVNILLIPDNDKPPPVPERASTLPNRLDSSSRSQNTSRRYSGPELPPKSPLESKPQFNQEPSGFMDKSKFNKFDIIVNSLESVGGSIWIGRSNGDVCVINTRLPTAGQSNCGKVVAIFENKLRQYTVSIDEKVKLVKAGKYVVATYSVTGMDSTASHTEIALWDAFDAEDVERIQSYWEKISCIEKKIADETKKVSVNLGTV